MNRPVLMAISDTSGDAGASQAVQCHAMPCHACMPCHAMPCLPSVLLTCCFCATQSVAAAGLQDGRTTSEEVLRAMVLDGAVDEEAVDADVFEVFDK